MGTVLFYFYALWNPGKEDGETVTERVLITGGAGFIGSHLADELLEHDYHVRVMDCLDPQVHGPQAALPSYLHPEVEFVRGDVRDADAVVRALERVDRVVHLAAAVGVGQSMYELDHYTDVNSRGTAVLLKALLNRPVERLVTASSMSIYGEGAYRRQARPTAGLVLSAARTPDQLRAGAWELHDADGALLEPVPTSETKPPCLASVYALSKYDQECMSLMIGRAYRIPTLALRFFNVYGPRQSLSNPYTGVLAIFASRFLNRKPPMIFEDGLQRRDFVSVHDVARACRQALEAPASVEGVLNIGSGRSSTVLDIARAIQAALGSDIEPVITRTYRVGDIRHCFANVAQAEAALDYRPRVSLDAGIRDYVRWLDGQAARDHLDFAAAELETRGLTVHGKG